MAKYEICAGCGIRAFLHPVVAIMHTDEAKAIEAIPVSGENKHGFVQVPVCRACHEDPSHRTAPLKAHFHFRADAKTGHQFASSNLDGGGVGM